MSATMVTMPVPVAVTAKASANRLTSHMGRVVDGLVRCGEVRGGDEGTKAQTPVEESAGD